MLLPSDEGLGERGSSGGVRRESGGDVASETYRDAALSAFVLGKAVIERTDAHA